MEEKPKITQFGKEIYQIWISERPNQLAAALAYYGMFSFAPVIYIAITIASLFFNQFSLMDRFLSRVETAVGPDLANLIENAVVTLTPESGNFLTSIISFIALLLAASGLFFQLQFVLNTIWRIPPAKKDRTWVMIRQRLFSFIVVIGVGLLLVASTLASLLYTWINSWELFELPGTLYNFAALFALMVLAFALLYKILPDIKISWRDVWLGSILAASLVTLGGWLVIEFLGSSRFSSAFEAAGAFAMLLIGIYYIAQIFLLGAVVTRVYAHLFGSMRSSMSSA